MEAGLRPGLRRGLYGKTLDPYLRQLIGNKFGGLGMRFDVNPLFAMPLGMATPIPGNTNITLSSNYTYNSAGIAVGFKFLVPADDYLTDVYFICTAKTGSPGALRCELRGMLSVNQPSSTLLLTDNVTPAGAAKWVRWTLSTPQALSRNNGYFVVAGDTAGSAGNSWQIERSPGVSGSCQALSVIGCSTTTGWASGNTTGSNAGCCVLRFASGRVMGQPMSGTGILGNATVKRGLLIAGITAPIYAIGMYMGSSGPFASASDRGQIYGGSQGSGETPAVADEPCTASGILAAPQLLWFKKPAILLPGMRYRAVVSCANSNSGGGAIQIPGDGASYPDLINSLCYGTGKIIGTTSSGGGWADDPINLYGMGLVIQQLRMR